MGSANYLRAIEAERLKNIVLKIQSSQVILKEPKKIEMSIWRNDERTEKQFEIQIEMPWGNLYTIASYDTKEKAEKEYEKMVEELKNGRAKIKIGKSVSLKTSG